MRWKRFHKLWPVNQTKEWKNWRTVVFQRDGHKCFLCGTSQKTLHPHHIFRRSKYPELIFVVKNGITLCEDCHRKKGIHIAGGEFQKRFMRHTKLTQALVRLLGS